MGLFSSKKSEEPSAQATGTITLGDQHYTVSQVVDVLGDSCPRPQLMTKKALSKAAPGAVIEVKVDNPTSMEAIPTMMPELHGSHLGTIKAERYWRVFVRKN
ncbi:MAG: sulfurtransferase TusA family protein [Gammaproteobacteria bacterium]|nr:sulfurtransferase TusA family protein [Gammaproteobacteria bacterium]